jgi:hypothetical protein
MLFQQHFIVTHSYLPLRHLTWIQKSTSPLGMKNYLAPQI